MALGSNRARPKQIERFWVLGARGGGGTPPEQSSAAASSPEKVFWGLQGSFWTGVWPWRTSVERVTHLLGYRGSRRSGVVGAKAEAVARGGTSPAQGVRGVPVVY